MTAEFCFFVAFAGWPVQSGEKGAVEPIIAMGFVRSKRSVAVVGVMGF